MNTNKARGLGIGAIPFFKFLAYDCRKKSGTIIKGHRIMGTIPVSQALSFCLEIWNRDTPIITHIEINIPIATAKDALFHFLSWEAVLVFRKLIFSGAAHLLIPLLFFDAHACRKERRHTSQEPYYGWCLIYTPAK